MTQMFCKNRIKTLDSMCRGTIIICIIIIAATPFMSDLHYKKQEFWYIYVLVFFFFGFQVLSYYYNFSRNEKKVANMLRAISEFITYIFILTIFSYIAAYAGSITNTDFFIKSDYFFKFDWVKTYEFLLANTIVYNIFYISYVSMFPQFIFLIIWMSLSGNFFWLRVMVNAFVLLAFVTICISALFPVVEADVAYGITKIRHDGFRWIADTLPQAEHFLNLNNKIMTEIQFSNLRGIVSFPSFHTIIGIVLITCSSNIKYLNALFLVVNTLLIAATPSIGGHYLVDTLAGAIIALLGMAAILKFVQPGVPLFTPWWTSKFSGNIPKAQKI